jgi:RNA-binding protein
VRNDFSPVRGRDVSEAPVARTPRASVVDTNTPARALSASQKRYLRGFAHDLKAVILVGQKGVTPSLLAEFELALQHHELVKVKLADDERDARIESIERIRAHANAELVQAIGKVACFYRRNPERAQFVLPK